METDPSGSTSISGTLAGGGAANLTVPIGTGDWRNLEELVVLAESSPFGLGGATTEGYNIVVNAVPVPAALWLFGSGLAMPGWMKSSKGAGLRV